MLVNAIFALVLLIMVLISSIYAIVSKNPDTRYQPMRDDRGSFIKSQSNLNTELDALGVTARGEKMKRDLDDDSDSMSSAAMSRKQYDASHVPLPASTAGSTRSANPYGQPPASPINASTPFIPNGGESRHGTPTGYNEKPSYSNGGYAGSESGYSRSQNASPGPRHNQGGYGGSYGYDRSGSLQSNTSYRPQNNGGSQWQRGAGYDH